MIQRLAIGLVLTPLLMACASGDGATGTSGEPGTTTPATADPDESSTTTGAGTTTTITYPSIAASLGVELMEQFTPTSGGGVHPILEWSAVDSAARYYVIVSAPSGRVYWAWRTEDTSIPVGGLPRLNEDAAGPAVSAGMSWVVTALDAEGSIVGISARRPISP